VNEGTSARAAQLLQQKGYTKVAALKGGQNEWEAKKFPIEAAKPAEPAKK
jgi:3-mercaptopyruvate sulfurtransferase SseA